MGRAPLILPLDLNGFGTYKSNTSSNGERYVGEFKNDMFEGFGTYNFPNGSVYTGEFKEGLFHGDGIYTISDGTEFEGFFEFGEFKHSH